MGWYISSQDARTGKSRHCTRLSFSTDECVDHYCTRNMCTLIKWFLVFWGKKKHKTTTPFPLILFIIGVWREWSPAGLSFILLQLWSRGSHRRQTTPPNGRYCSGFKAGGGWYWNFSSLEISATCKKKKKKNSGTFCISFHFTYTIFFSRLRPLRVSDLNTVVIVYFDTSKWVKLLHAYNYSTFDTHRFKRYRTTTLEITCDQLSSYG